MPSKLTKNTIFYTLGLLFPKAAQFVLLPIYTRYLTPADYGVLSNVQAISSVLVIIYTLSLNKAIFRLYFDFQTENEKRDFLGTIFIGLAISTLIITSAVLGLSETVGSIYQSIEFYPYMALSVLSSALATFFLVPKTAYFVKEKANVFVLLSILEFVVHNVFVLLFVVILDGGALGYLQGYLFANMLLLPLFLFLTWKQVNFKFAVNIYTRSLRFSIPLLPMMLSAWVMNLSDRIFIERYFATHDVGIYSLGYKISMLVLVFSGSFYKAYNPFYFKTASNYNKDKATKILKRTNTIYVLIILLFCSMISLFAKEAVSILFDQRYHEAYKIVVILCLAYVFGQSNGVFNLAIYQEKKTIFLMVVNITGAIINIGLNFLLISKYGAYGAAWATVCTFFVLFLATKHFAKKCFYVSFNTLIVYPLFLFLLLGNVLFYFTDFDILYSILLKFLFIGTVSSWIWFKYKHDLKSLLSAKHL